jgi:hypothetical protein
VDAGVEESEPDDALGGEPNHLEGDARAHGVADGGDRPVSEDERGTRHADDRIMAREVGDGYVGVRLERSGLCGPDARIAQKTGKKDDLQSLDHAQ